MNAIIFVGPTIPVPAARAIFDAVYLPPARAGDVLAAARKRPRPDAIALIDGLFEAVPAVWHKEILYALAEGIPVYGASSMGALRAAELHTFGMIGIGKIFEAFASGELEDDDEVAVIHAPLSEGCTVLSEAMVNIRDRLRAALTRGLITAATHDRLVLAAKGMHYSERSWRALERLALPSGVGADEVKRLMVFLHAEPMDRKRQDAIELLRVLADRAQQGFEPHKPRFRLERSIFFERFLEADARLGPQLGVTHEAAIRRAKVTLSDSSALRGGLLLSLALAEASRLGIEVPAAELARHEELHRLRRGLERGKDFAAWLRDNHLSRETFNELVRIDAIVARLLEDKGRHIDRFVALELQREGAFARIVEALGEERGLLRAVGLEEPTLEAAGTSAEEVLEWYQGHVRPIIGALEEHARGLGFADELDFLREATTLFVAARERNRAASRRAARQERRVP